MSVQIDNNISNQVRSDFNFTVDKFPLSGPDGMKTPFYGLFRSDNGTVVGSSSVTDRYCPHTTDDVCALVDAAGAAFDNSIACKTHFRNGHYVDVAPTREQRKVIFSRNNPDANFNGHDIDQSKDVSQDSIFPRLLIRASYDGRAFAASIGYYRDLCSNLHIMHSVKSSTVTIRHTSNLRTKMDDLIGTFQSLKNSWTDISKVVDHLENRTINMADFIRTLYGTPDSDAGKKEITIYEKRVEDIFNRLARERLQVGKTQLNQSTGYNVTAWEALNAIQGYVQHDARSKKGFKSDFDRIIRASNDAVVRRAESVLLAV